MFGKPQWFRARPIGWSVVPATWQGWLYATGWSGAIGFPALLLMCREQFTEAFLWTVLATGALAYDAWKIWRWRSAPVGSFATNATSAAKAVNNKVPDLLYITESNVAR